MRIFRIIMAVLIIAAIIVFFIIDSKKGKEEYIITHTDTDKIESQIPKLPEDQKAATAELNKAKKALKKIKPVKSYIVIDTHANILSLRTEEKVLFKGNCSTGSGGELVDSLTGRKWVFNTPKGVFKVNSKLTDPWWRKPDWAFLEEKEDIPNDENSRYDPEMLGEYAMGFGNGYFIHGTIYERLIGVSVTHGCVRLGTDDLKYIFKNINIGTPVYIF